ncbi:MAG: Hsp70 family protein [Alphaproteobacteria bacterium]|nr:Hsp70 family protein [Alphaproteobacteria bacterium]
MSKVSCGIDFGTTNSAVSIAKHSSTPEVVPLEGNNLTIPTAIFFEEDTNNVFYGSNALKNYIDGSRGRFMRSMKRILGSNLMNVGTKINNKSVKFDFVLSKFLKNIKEKSDQYAKENIENVVLGRPVHFRDNDPQGDAQAQEELKNIAKSVGYKNIEFQYEPIAAAFAHETKILGEELACVVDIGGGTSDISIIKLGQKLQNKTNRTDDILANTGVRIGGNDFDKNLSLKSFMPHFGIGTTYGSKNLPVPSYLFSGLSEWSNINNEYNYKNLNMVNSILQQSNSKELYGRLYELLEKETAHTLLNMVEITKMELTDKEDTVVLLKFMDNPFSVISNRKDFEDSIHQNVNKICLSVKECISMAKIKKEDIDLLILTGGSTEIPYIQKHIKSYFSNAKLSQENKLASVGLGLAFDAKRKFL